MKSVMVAYLLWCLVFLGFAGIHRFYAGKWVSGLNCGLLVAYSCSGRRLT